MLTYLENMREAIRLKNAKKGYPAIHNIVTE